MSNSTYSDYGARLSPADAPRLLMSASVITNTGSEQSSGDGGPALVPDWLAVGVRAHINNGGNTIVIVKYIGAVESSMTACGSACNVRKDAATTTAVSMAFAISMVRSSRHCLSRSMLYASCDITAPSSNRCILYYGHLYTHTYRVIQT